MPKVIGVSVVGMRKLFAKSGKHAEEQFISRLSERDAKAYRSIVATTWTDVETLTRIFEAAAQTLYKYEADPLNKLLYTLAEQSYSGIYSIFLLIPKRSYVFKRVADIWSAYHELGVAKAVVKTKKSGDFVVSGYLGFTEFLRKMVTCHIDVILLKTGSKKNYITFDDSKPGELVWHIEWT